MKLFRRFLRLFSTVGSDPKRVFGTAGEEYVVGVLSSLGYCLFVNRIIPHPYKPHRYIESDVVVYSDSCVFCVEVKRYRGRVFKVEDGIVQETECKAYERGRGKVYRAKRLKDPMVQSRFFTRTLREMLVSQDDRFRRINFIPVVVFLEEADVSSIHSFERGVIYAYELPDFIRSHLRSGGSYDWVVKALEGLKGFDVVVDRSGFGIKGLIVGDVFKCESRSGRVEENLSLVKLIEIMPGGLFSSCDKVRLTRKDGFKEEFCCVDGYVDIDVFGERRRYFLRNILSVVVNSRI